MHIAFLRLRFNVFQLNIFNFTQTYLLSDFTSFSVFRLHLLSSVTSACSIDTFVHPITSSQKLSGHLPVFSHLNPVNCDLSLTSSIPYPLPQGWCLLERCDRAGHCLLASPLPCSLHLFPAILSSVSQSSARGGHS